MALTWSLVKAVTGCGTHLVFVEGGDSEDVVVGDARDVVRQTHLLQRMRHVACRRHGCRQVARVAADRCG